MGRKIGSHNKHKKEKPIKEKKKSIYDQTVFKYFKKRNKH